MDKLLTKIYFDFDNFCKALEKYYIKHLIPGALSINL